MSIPFLPESAPFSSEQRHYLNGFLAGALQNGSAAQNGHAPTGMTAIVAPPASVTNTLPVQVFYGSQSGNAEGLAESLGSMLGKTGKITAKVHSLESHADLDWSAGGHALLVCSTWGDGEMPDNAVAFWEWLSSESAPKLEGWSFAVLGLGDKNYRQFCHSGKQLDTRFAELGAKRLLDFQPCDTDYETIAEEWMSKVEAALAEAAPAIDLSATNSPSASATPSPKSASGSESKSKGVASQESIYSKKNPFPSPLLENHPLNAKGSAKDTRHINLSLHGSGLEYRAGDALGVCPRNDYDLVDRMVLRLNALGTESVTLSDGKSAPLRGALLNTLDLRRPSAELIATLRDATSNSGEKNRLEKLVSSPQDEEAQQFLKGLDVLDVLERFPHATPEPQAVVACFGKIAPRLYSIASSPLERAGEVHLCIGIQRLIAHGRLRRGIASTYLAERVPLGMPVGVYVQPTSHFLLPKDSGVPIIMVGPGTGIAPFRAFLQDRRQRGDTGKNWLFFGDQHREYDFLYAEEMVAFQNDGFLTRMDLAFSRDQEEKVYVQTRMLEAAHELYAWLEKGAYFYVCGDAKRMAKDVDAALHQVVAAAGGKTLEQAQEYIAALKSQKRYLRDVY
jgi:sulfite reductase (NADPH) flavoprotein alpha-component